MRRRTAIVLSALLALAIGEVPASASGHVRAGRAPAGGPPAARATPLDDCSTAYLEGDARLGPEDLAVDGPLATILHGYHRLAGLTAQDFLARYWDPAAQGGKGGWRYPPMNGFLIGHDGRPIESPRDLRVGERLDRFGSEYGAFLAPEGESFAGRALPPQSLDVFDPAYTCNYHVYGVIRSFRVEAGPIAPGFGQRGHGLQFQVLAALLSDSAAVPNIGWLVAHGYLQRIN